MKIKLCTSVAGGQAGDEVSVADEYGTWLAWKGYAVRVHEEQRTQKINEKNEDHENGSSKRSSRARK